jgi:preprotein translocase subunit SecA
MAGRGTDIKLTPESKELGGLAVLGSERHESRRIDNQLRGRSGRQGDPGFSRFYVSLEDELMVRFGSERMSNMFEMMGDAPIENKMVTKSISTAQQRVEGMNFDIRKTLLDYDDVLRQQRETIYEQRNFILENEDVHGVVEEMFKRVISNLIASFITIDNKKEIIDTEAIVAALKHLGLDVMLSKEDLDNLSREEINDKCHNLAWNAYENKIAAVKEAILPQEKVMVLRMIDRAWVNHIDIMSKLREGIHLRSYAQNNPLQAYVEEGYELFEDMMDTVANDVVRFCINARIVTRESK